MKHLRTPLSLGLLIAAVLVLGGCTAGSAATSWVDQTIAWVSGLVSKSRGEPVANATVTLEESAERTTTDSQGRFQIATHRRGSNTLRAEASEYLTLRWPISIDSTGAANLRLRLVTMRDYNAALFDQLTGASSGGTWRWAAGTVTYYVDRTGAYRPEFDGALRDGFAEWSMLTQRTVTFAEGNNTSAIQVSYVSSAPCGLANAVGCAGVTSVTANGEVRGALIELHAGFATDLGLTVHEVGHVLSFTGHSPNSTDVMYFQMNGTSSASNAEAAVASVLYYNAPGTAMGDIRTPSAQMAQIAPSPAILAIPRAPQPAALLPPATPAPSFGALESIGAMVRSWFASLQCLLPLPGACQSPAWSLP